MPHPPKLLLLLDAFARREGPAPNLAGKVAVGVVATDGPVWWQASLGRELATRFVDTPDRDVTAAILLDADTADAIVAGRKGTKPKLRAAYGDGALMTQVLDRYLKKINLVGIRRSDV